VTLNERAEEAVMIYFKAASRNSPGGYEKNYENLTLVGVSVEI